LGECNFYRRQLKSFIYSSALITVEKLNKSVASHWSPREDKALNDLNLKLKKKSVELGTPRPSGEFVILTGASDMGGGACLFLGQTLDPQVLQNWHTQGVKLDGSLRHTYPNDCTLTPLGNGNGEWKSIGQDFFY